MAGAIWNCRYFGASSVYTIQPCKLHANHIHLAVTCHLHFWQNDWDLLHATVVTRGVTDTEIRVSTESQPWSRKFSHRSCRDSNPRPFSHEWQSNHWAIPAPHKHCSMKHSWFHGHPSNQHGFLCSHLPVSSMITHRNAHLWDPSFWYTVDNITFCIM